MSLIRTWATSDDGKIEYVSLTLDKLEGSMAVLRNSFFIYEKVCIGVELSKHPEAAKELEELCLSAAKDGVSLIAVEKQTGKVVGVAFNKLQIKTEESNYFEEYAANCKYPSAKVLVQFMNDADAVVDLFDLCKTNCLLEIMFLAVHPEFYRKTIGTKLVECSIQLAKTLKSGENTKVALNSKPLPNKPIPTIVTAIFTSNISQSIGKKVGFTVAAKISYEKFIFEGRSFASRIGPDTPFGAVAYKFI